VRTAAAPAAAVLAVAGSLLVGCTTGGPTANPTGSPTPASPSTASTTGGGQVPTPAAGEVARVVVRQPGDATTVTADVPPNQAGYVVDAGCVGDPGTQVTWLVTPAVGPAGVPVTGTVACDGAAHRAPAVEAGPVPVRVVLRVDVERSVVREAFAVLRAAD
jgi:hypothetical protein